MKWASPCLLLVAAAVVVSTGCNKSQKGGTSDAGFTIAPPKTSTSMKPNEKKEVEVSVSRDDGFKQDLKLEAKVSPSDKGVTVAVPKDVKAADKTFHVTVTTAEKAEAAEYTVTVTATPA